MPINPIDLRNALQNLAAFDPQYPRHIHTSTSGPSVRAAVTTFAWLLAIELAPAHGANVLAGDFRGGAGRGAAGRPGAIAAIQRRIEASLRNAGLNRVAQAIVDLTLYANAASKLEPLAAIESEARVQQPGGNLWDFEKLLLSRARRRVFIYRVNITVTGNTRRQRGARNDLLHQFRLAQRSQARLIAPNDELDIIEIVTSREIRHRSFWYDTWRHGATGHNFRQL